eukprot:TRINITY_DN2512_c0_g1_i1.p1 TRINITY_DN2512_c0_g1~~TRINITY_DN2512_c0_g1_i1.p1  ORF type:complete len:192 (-),score=23.46 TRINITY_DN2512_c0_g1_i1:383-958(-)
MSSPALLSSNSPSSESHPGASYTGFPTSSTSLSMMLPSVSVPKLVVPPTLPEISETAIQPPKEVQEENVSKTSPLGAVLKVPSSKKEVVGVRLKPLAMPSLKTALRESVVTPSGLEFSWEPPKLLVTLHKCQKHLWNMFAKHHYMDGKSKHHLVHLLRNCILLDKKEVVKLSVLLLRLFILGKGQSLVFQE